MWGRRFEIMAGDMLPYDREREIARVAHVICYMYTLT